MAKGQTKPRTLSADEIHQIGSGVLGRWRRVGRLPLVNVLMTRQGVDRDPRDVARLVAYMVKVIRKIPHEIDALIKDLESWAD